MSRLMGHANEAITGTIYVHEIERRDHSERTREAMRRAFAESKRHETHAMRPDDPKNEASCVT